MNTLALWNTTNKLINSSVFEFATMSTKILKQRMKSVTSIKKITKAMKMVAASKMKLDVQRLENGKFFGVSSVQTVLNNESYL